MSKCACCDETESLPLPPSLPPPFTASLATVRCDIMQLSPWRSLGDGPSLDNVNSLHLSLCRFDSRLESCCEPKQMDDSYTPTPEFKK